MDLRGADLHGIQCGRRGAQVDVMVVQTRYHGAAAGVECCFGQPRSQRVGDLFDSSGHPDVGDPTIQQVRPLDQHGTEFR